MSSIIERKSLQFETQKLNNPMSYCPFSTLIYLLNLALLIKDRQKVEYKSTMELMPCAHTNWERTK